MTDLEALKKSYEDDYARTFESLSPLEVEYLEAQATHKFGIVGDVIHLERLKLIKCLFAHLEIKEKFINNFHEAEKKLSDCAKQNQILRDTLKEAKDLVSDMILAVHIPANMAGWPKMAERALKLLEGETNGKQEKSDEESQTKI
jgi:hypothetical protein